MRVLFVRSGNNGLDPISTNQGKSLEKEGIEIIYYNIIGKGIFGHLKRIINLSKEIKTVVPDIIHAHYSISGILTTFAGRKAPIVMSLMGSDLVTSGFIRKIILLFFVKYLWKKTIVKSIEMFKMLNIKFVEVIPNGVDLFLFKQTEIAEAQSLLGWDKGKQHILFCSDPNRDEKNFKLAQASIDYLKNKMNNVIIETHFLNKISPEKVPLYLSASHVLLLTSKHEGSPNVIKEAMACNCPIVATNVGDIKWVIGNTEGCYITSFNPEDVAEKIIKVFDFGQKTNGRDRIVELGLDTKTVAKKIIKVYQNILNK